MCSDPFIGTIMTTAIDFAPVGWAICDGKTIPINQNQALFSLIGFIYGGNNTTEFKIPDLRCRMPVGVGSAPAVTSRTYTRGQAGGHGQITLAPTQVPLPAHTHTATFTPTKGKETVDIPAKEGKPALSVKVSASSQAGTLTSPAAGSYLAGSSFGSAKIYTATATSPVELGGVEISGNPDFPAQKVDVTTVTGGDIGIAPTGQVATQAVDLTNPFLALNFIIALEGLYPPKS